MSVDRIYSLCIAPAVGVTLMLGVIGSSGGDPGGWGNMDPEGFGIVKGCALLRAGGRRSVGRWRTAEEVSVPRHMYSVGPACHLGTRRWVRGLWKKRVVAELEDAG